MFYGASVRMDSKPSAIRHADAALQLHQMVVFE